MHIVEMGKLEQSGERNPKEASFFMSVEETVMLVPEKSNCFGHHEDIEKELFHGRANTDCANESHFRRPMNDYVGDVDVLTNMVRYQVYLMTQFRQGLQSPENAQRSSSWLKKWLGRQHQNFHGKAVRQQTDTPPLPQLQPKISVTD